MADLIAKLQLLVNSDRFLKAAEFQDIDKLLDARDAEPFERKWMRLHEAIEPLRLSADPTVEALRESAFKRAYSITEHPEICGYVSDDFGLLADVLRADLADTWATSLFSCYCSGKFPHGELSPASAPLNEAIDEFKL